MPTDDSTLNLVIRRQERQDEQLREIAKTLAEMNGSLSRMAERDSEILAQLARHDVLLSGNGSPEKGLSQRMAGVEREVQAAAVFIAELRAASSHQRGARAGESESPPQARVRIGRFDMDAAKVIVTLLSVVLALFGSLLGVEIVL